METIGVIIIVIIFLAIGYSLLNEYLAKEDIRPVYHVIGAILLIGLIGVIACGGSN